MSQSSDQDTRVFYNTTSTEFFSRFDIGETIGVGGFAVVKGGTCKRTGERVAIKVLPSFAHPVSQFHNHFTHLSIARCPLAGSRQSPLQPER